MEADGFLVVAEVEAAGGEGGGLACGSEDHGATCCAHSTPEATKAMNRMTRIEFFMASPFPTQFSEMQ